MNTEKPGWNLHPLQAVILVVALFILAQGIALAAVLAVSAILSGVGGSVGGWLDNNTNIQFLTIAAIEIGTILGVRAVLRRKRLHWADIGLSRPKAVDVVLAVLAFMAYLVVFYLLVQAIQALIPGFDSGQRQDIGFGDVGAPLQLAMVFLALVVLAPLAEEILFRGLLFSALRAKLSFLLSMIITSVLFGAAHLLGREEGASLLWIAGVDTLVLSFALCYLREKTGRLWAPILLHAIKNSLAFALLFLAV